MSGFPYIREEQLERHDSSTVKIACMMLLNVKDFDYIINFQMPQTMEFHLFLAGRVNSHPLRNILTFYSTDMEEALVEIIKDVSYYLFKGSVTLAPGEKKRSRR